MVEGAYVARSAFAGLAVAAGTGQGVRATEREGLGIARLTARRRQAGALQRLVRDRFDLVLPAGPRRTGSGELAVAGIGPESWLMTREHAGYAFAIGLRASLGSHAAVLDLSDAYVMLRLTGEKVRETLAKLVPVDLHARRFQVNDVVQTFAEHMAVTLWRLEDTARGEAMFEISVGRSLARSLHEAICDSAAEFGCVFAPA
jgi:sarcosine oxidase subunit gamma